MGKVIHIFNGQNRGKKSMNVLSALFSKNNVDGQKVLSALYNDSGLVHITELATAYGFKVLTQKMDPPELSGYILISDKIRDTFKTDKIIVVNADDSYGHKRFTVAHELAHYLFDYKSGEYAETYKTNDSESEQEKKANRFAAEILMPKDEFIKCMEENKQLDNDTRIFEIAKRFGVSETAVKRRINEIEE